jgi:hypothetical protein
MRNAHDSAFLASSFTRTSALPSGLARSFTVPYTRVPRDCVPPVSLSIHALASAA